MVCARAVPPEKMVELQYTGTATVHRPVSVCPRGAGCSNSSPQTGAKTFGGLEGGGGGVGRWVGRSAAGLPRGGQ